MSMFPIDNHCAICNHRYSGRSPFEPCPNCHPRAFVLFQPPDIEEEVGARVTEHGPEFNIVVAGIVVKNGKILLSQRKDAHSYHFGRWECSGGSVEEGETAREALVREYKEETLMDVNVHNWICTTMVAKPDEFMSLIIIHYLCTSKDEPTETDECVTPTWYEPKALIDDSVVIMPGMMACRQIMYDNVMTHIENTDWSGAGGDRRP